MALDLSFLKELYQKNENLMEYMRNKNEDRVNTVEQIMISYDFQAGTYVAAYYKDPNRRAVFLNRLREIIISKSISGAVLEAGIGEGTSLIPLLNLLGPDYFNEAYGFDISWSRIKVAKQFCVNQNQQNVHLFTGDLLNIPIVDDYFDVVFTVHAIESNEGKEKEILRELYRVCKQYLILLEPCYELANEEARQRIRKYGCITGLSTAVKELNYHVETYELYGDSLNPLHPTGLMIISKDNPTTDCKHISPFACPISKKPMVQYGDSFYCHHSMLAYPIIQSIPCLAANNAVVATQYLEQPPC